MNNVEKITRVGRGKGDGLMGGGGSGERKGRFMGGPPENQAVFFKLYISREWIDDDGFELPITRNLQPRNSTTSLPSQLPSLFLTGLPDKHK